MPRSTWRWTRSRRRARPRRASRTRSGRSSPPPLFEDPQDLASDRGLPARRLRDRGAADLAQDRARGAVEDDLLVAAILALDPEEPARGLRDHLWTSTSSNFFARMPGRWWAFLHSRQRKRRWIFFVGFSRPSGFGRGKPPYPAVTRRNRLWPARSSDRGRFFTRSTSSSTCLLQKGQ